MSETLAGIDVIEGWTFVVHPKQENAHRLITCDVGVTRFLDIFDLIYRQIRISQVERAVEQGEHPGRGDSARPDLDPADRLRVVRPALEMTVEPLHVDLFERRVGFGDQLISP